MTCEQCGQEVPAQIKHVPSRSTDGMEFGGTHPCLVLAVDKDGRTAREAAEWAKLQRAAQHHVRHPIPDDGSRGASEAPEGVGS